MFGAQPILPSVVVPDPHIVYRALGFLSVSSGSRQLADQGEKFGWKNLKLCWNCMIAECKICLAQVLIVSLHYFDIKLYSFLITLPLSGADSGCWWLSQLYMGECRVHLWMSCQVIKGPMWAFGGSVFGSGLPHDIDYIILTNTAASSGSWLTNCSGTCSTSLSIPAWHYVLFIMFWLISRRSFFIKAEMCRYGPISSLPASFEFSFLEVHLGTCSVQMN